MKWDEVKLKSVLLKIIGGGTPSKSNNEYWNGDIPWCSVKDMSVNRFQIANTVDSISQLGLDNSSSNLIPAGTVITSTRMGLGRAFINKVDMAINQDLKALIPNSKIDNSFLLWTLINNATTIEGLGIGSTVKGIRLEVLKDLSFPLPPLPTQRKIAGILSAYDDLIENNLKRIKLLEEQAFICYKSYFGFLSSSFDESGIPNEWLMKRADEIFDITIGKTPPREQSTWFNDKDSYVCWSSIKDLNQSNIFLTDTEESVTEMAVDTFNMKVADSNVVLLSFKLTVGKVAITTMKTTTNEAIAHFNNKSAYNVFPEYTYFYLKNFPYDTLGSTSSIGKAINSKVVKSMPFLLPPIDILNAFHKNVCEDFYLIKNLIYQNSKLREARDILLPRLMNGQIEV